MEKRNYVTSSRTPGYDSLEKEASFDDSDEQLASEFDMDASEEDEKSDKEHLRNNG